MLFARKFVNFTPVLAFLALLGVTSCSAMLSPTGENGSVLLTVTVPVQSIAAAARFIHPDTRSVTVTVTSTDMETITEKANSTQGSSSIVIELTTVPSGKNRNIHVALYDGDGSGKVLLAEGSATVDIVSGITNKPSITALPANALSVTLGTSSAIEAGSAGKTIVYSTALETGGKCAVKLSAETPSPETFALSAYNPNGRKIDLAKNDITGISTFTAATPGLYYVALSVPADFTGISSILIDDEITVPPVVPIIVVPASPAEPTLTAGDGQLGVGWTAVEGAVNYELWYSTVNDTATPSPTQFGGDLTGTAVTITGLTNGTTYYVWLKAKNTAGSSGFGTVASGTPLAASTTLTVSVSFTNPAEPALSITGPTTVNAWSSLSVGADAGFAEYQWLLNGTILSGKTANLLTLSCDNAMTPELIFPGVNTLIIIVKNASGEYYSAGIYFTIIQ